MADRLFKLYMIPAVVLVAILYWLPDFSLKIPLGLLVLFAAATMALYKLWETEKETSKDPDIKV